MAKNNYPQGKLDNIEPETKQTIISSLRELHEMGKPQNDNEVKERIDQYFMFCEKSSMRPGVESLSLSLHITRTTLFNWSKGIGCTPQCQEYIESAKGFIAAFIEQALLSGKINPASGIFIMKNWLNYKDTVSLEDNIPQTSTRQVLIADQLPKLGDME